MTKYVIEAERHHYYRVEIDAVSPDAAEEEVRDWIAEDFERYEIKAEWKFETYEKLDNGILEFIQ